MSLVNRTAQSRLWFCPIKGLDPTRPPIVPLCLGSLVQVYISSQCLTPVVYDSAEALALGVPQVDAGAVGVVTGNVAGGLSAT